MLIYDYSGIALGSIIANRELNQELVRHMILNTIRMYRQKFPKKDYGDVVIACDGANNWRRGAFPQYKANRRKSREESDFDWNEAFRILNEVREEIRETFPYRVIHVEGCEADDIIGTLVANTQEFGQYENIMIISADKDFAQLQRFENVKQYSPLTKKFIEEKNPRVALIHHVLKGDAGDGVPNVLSNDDVFVEGLRQTPLSKKKLDTIVEQLEKNELLHDASWYRNFQRNQRLIDLTFTPQHLKDTILKEFEKDPVGNGSLILPYLINKKCKMLIEVAAEFN